MIVALVLGIVACVVCFIGIFVATIPMSIISIIVGVCAIIFGAKNRDDTKGMAGFICGIIATVAGFILLVIMLAILL